MQCPKCSTAKISSEFPIEPLADACEHAPTWCLQCLCAGLKQAVCPECSAPVTEEVRKKLASLLRDTTGEYQVSIKVAEEKSTSNDATIFVSTLEGQSLVAELAANSTVLALKQKVESISNVSRFKQRIMFRGEDLSDTSSLVSCGIQHGQTVQLLITMLSEDDIKGITHLTFDLVWGYPAKGRDYLDGSCLGFSGTTFVGVLDYSHRTDTAVGGVSHSSDLMDDPNKRGHHIIQVELPKVSKVVTHLFFTLSAYSSPSIRAYPNPAVQLFEKNMPNKELSGYQVSSYLDTQAVVMCCLARKGEGWTVVRCGKPSAGTVRNYSAIQATIQQLVPSIN